VDEARGFEHGGNGWVLLDHALNLGLRHSEVGIKAITPELVESD
jgi:hypothetical protein